MFQEYAIEFLGTLFLMFVILTTQNYLAIGATLSICIYLAAGVSKQAFNPAVAIALMHCNALPAYALIPYMLAEIGGAVAAIYLIRIIKSRS